jgi:hypothetical protein
MGEHNVFLFNRTSVLVLLPLLSQPSMKRMVTMRERTNMKMRMSSTRRLNNLHEDVPDNTTAMLDCHHDRYVMRITSPSRN